MEKKGVVWVTCAVQVRHVQPEDEQCVQTLRQTDLVARRHPPRSPGAGSLGGAISYGATFVAFGPLLGTPPPPDPAPHSP